MPFLAWAQIRFLDEASFLFPSAFSLLFTWHLPKTLDLLFKFFLQQQKRAQTSRSPTLPANTKWFLLSEMRTSNILQNLYVQMGLRATSKGLWASVVVWFFFCNRLWNGCWHCFSCDIV